MLFDGKCCTREIHFNLSEHRILFNTNLDLLSLRILFLYTFQLTSLYIFKDLSKLMSWCIFQFQGCSETPSNQTVYYNSKLFRYFRYKFFDVKFFILDNAIPQMLLSLIYQTRVSFFWSTKYTQRKINICHGFMR